MKGLLRSWQMVRTKNQIRGSKSKGSQFEMNVEYSLKKLFPNIKRLGGEGQWREIDLECKSDQFCVECKKHKKFSWNELVGYLDKLTERSPYKTNYLIYQENHKPAMVMVYLFSTPMVTTFEWYFGVKFEKHKIIKKRRSKDEIKGPVTEH